VNQDVDLSGKSFQYSQPRLTFQVERQGFFATVKDLENMRVTLSKSGPHVTRIIAAIQAFNFDHFGAKICENCTGKRPSKNLA
jgi:hypothetical protein